MKPVPPAGGHLRQLWHHAKIFQNKRCWQSRDLDDSGTSKLSRTHLRAQVDLPVSVLSRGYSVHDNTYLKSSVHHGVRLYVVRGSLHNVLTHTYLEGSTPKRVRWTETGPSLTGRLLSLGFCERVSSP